MKSVKYFRLGDRIKFRALFRYRLKSDYCFGVCNCLLIFESGLFRGYTILASANAVPFSFSQEHDCLNASFLFDALLKNLHLGLENSQRKK